MSPLRYAFAVANRILHLLVFGPAMAALFLYGLAYQFSIEAAVRDTYEYIETTAKASKNAPPRYLSLPACMKVEGSTPKFARCDTNVLKNYYVPDLSKRIASTLLGFYWMSVILGACFEAWRLGPYRFFLLDEPPGQSASSFIDRTKR